LSEFQLLKGDLLLALAGEAGGSSEAEAWYRQALERARRSNARISQLRAATRLCRIARDSSERDAARQTLAAVYSSFAEGGTIRDLVEARELLAAHVP
jgi:hypothetical protein